MELAAARKHRQGAQPARTPLHITQVAPSLSSTDPLAALLKPCPLMFAIDEARLDEFAALCTLATFERNEHVFAEREPSRGLWVLIDGRLRIYHSDLEGRQVVIDFPAPHTPLDLAAALDGRPHTVSAIALQRARLAFFTQSALAELAQKFPQTVRNAMRQLCREYRQRDISQAVFSFRGARGRVCCTLLQLARQYGIHHSEPGRVKINYLLTRQDLADRSGVTLETAIRVVSDLQRRGVIATKAQLIEILDQGALEMSSECCACDMDCSVFAKPTVADVQPLVQAESSGPRGSRVASISPASPPSRSSR